MPEGKATVMVLLEESLMEVCVDPTKVMPDPDEPELYVTLEADEEPKSTVDPLVNPLPEMVTEVAPVVGPDAGVIAVTVGGMVES